MSMHVPNRYRMRNGFLPALVDGRRCRTRDADMRHRPHIGSRWTPQHVVRQDSASGFYEELNAPSSRLSADAVALQSALLSRPRPSRIADWIFAGTLGVIGALLLVHFLAR